VGRGLGQGSVGHGTGHQDYSLPVARPPVIMFSRVNMTRPTRYPQATILAPGIVRSFFLIIEIVLIHINVTLPLMQRVDVFTWLAD
jgi:hypothetical protein